MKISLNWLKEYIQITESAEQIAALLTGSGLEVETWEEVESVKGGLKGLVIGEVITCAKHPNADKLSVTTVDIGEEQLFPIVCGAPNVRAGQKVIVATVGATLYPSSGDSFQIKKAKIRGEVSEGMICAEDEIGLGKSHDGILVLNTDLPNGAPAADYFNLESDFVFEIGLTPNRADGASHIGVARDLKALLNRPVTFPSVESFKADNEKRIIPVTVENTEACPRYSSLTITGVNVTDSPDWLKVRLNSIGIKPTNNVVDITNFVLHSLGQPMHAFDADEIVGDKVTVKTLPEGTTFTTLDEKERKLADTDLMICNEAGGMCIAGVFGGIKSGVKKTTKNVFLESAYFSPDYIRKSAQKHQLKTDASFRYERGTDPNITVYALKYAALLIKELAGGEISSPLADFYPTPIEDFKVDVKFANIDRLIGKAIGNDKIKSILESLDIQIQNETETGFTAIVPPYRVDVQREADIVEEVLRIYGYNNIEIDDHLSSTFLSEFPTTDADGIKKETCRLLAGAGFHEIVTNSLTKDGYSTGTAAIDENENVKILNYLSEDLNVMRQTLLFHGLEVIDRNVKRKNGDLKLFEFGTTYHFIKEKYVERSRLSLFITGNVSPESWLAPSRKVNFHDLSAIVLKLLAKFGIHKVESQETDSDLFGYGLSIATNKKLIVQLGKVNAEVAKLADVSTEVFYADFDWDYIQKLSTSEFTFQPISKYPEVKRDLSLVVDKAVNFDDIRKLAEKLERSLVNRISVFDVYEGDKIDAGKKAYAISFYLQDQEKTLTDKVIDKCMSRLMQGFERELGAVIRK
ncbi:phenylalanine--tRNA ligase subunit beta [Roseivirga seohaensis]|uniref:phenylalanine--tRNA ligase subunit beta n=1 Tax=Roseivirga seohaensis TaxID=1914963 RepID=UPI003BAD090C